MVKIKAKFRQMWLHLGKVEILHPQKHSNSYGDGEATPLKYFTREKVFFWKHMITGLPFWWRSWGTNTGGLSNSFFAAKHHPQVSGQYRTIKLKY